MHRLIWLVILLGPPCIASAKVLDVGPNQQYKQPSEAIAAASSGDDIRISPGQYFDCAIVKQDHLTIEGTAEGVILTDKMCADKALLVVDGDNVTIRSLVFQRARVPDHNGAGIRAEGGNLLVENSIFLNNENGILSSDNPSASIKIVKSRFVDNGKCDGSCGHAVYVGHIKLLHVESAQFFDTHQGHAIKSRALRTEVYNSDIADGPNGTSSYLIEVPNGGTLIVQNNRLEKGRYSQNQGNTIMIGSEGVTQPTDQIDIRNNFFINDVGHQTVFVTNRTATPANLTANTYKGQVKPLEGDGTVN